MQKLTGVYKTYKKNGQPYYRASITFRSKHISLGSFNDPILAHEAYQQAYCILYQTSKHLINYTDDSVLNFHKWIVLINYRDNGYYIKTPIYLHKYYFSYYLDESIELKFDVDDLFYYSNHKIFKKGSYLFVNDYGMQVNILSRYGIKNYAVLNKDYYFVDGDPSNFRYQNIIIINKYHGVKKNTTHNKASFITKIHINGDYIVGRYHTEIRAAIAYNKAADYLEQNTSFNKKYQRNYVELSELEYEKIYNTLKISNKLLLLKNRCIK